MVGESEWVIDVTEFVIFTDWVDFEAKGPIVSAHTEGKAACNTYVPGM